MHSAEGQIKVADAPAPLENIGNTCYLNAVIQILFTLNQAFSFGHWISKDVNYSLSSVLDTNTYVAFHKFLYLSTLDNINREGLSDFVSALSRIDSFFEIGKQKDAHEALLKLLKIFDEAICIFLPNLTGLKDTYFQGFYKTVKVCTNCNNTSVNFDPFCQIRITPTENVKKAIEDTFINQNFKCHCVDCGSVNKQIFSCTIYDHPRVLLIFIDRYTQFSPYMESRRDCGNMLIENVLELNGQIYRLGGIIMHLGTAVNSGHYIACVERGGILYICNDSVVHPIESFPLQSCEAYMLFFFKQLGT